MWKERRRKKLLSTPFPPSWKRILVERVQLYIRLPTVDRTELEGHTQVFLAEKKFEGCGGLEITDEIKVCIAAQACLLLLHRDTDYYPSLYSVLVYPGTYRAHVTRQLGLGVMNERHEFRRGEAWARGAVVLAWDSVCADASNFTGDRNVVLHEFAHFLDFEDGWSNGMPSLTEGKFTPIQKNSHAAWTQVWSAEFEKFCAELESGDEVYLDEYGAKNPAEFFAVATESFFQRPHRTQEHLTAIYEHLKRFYQQDPATWTPASAEADDASDWIRRADARLKRDDVEGALAIYTEGIAVKPDDADLYGYRGVAKERKGDLDGALADYCKTIELAPEKASPYVHRGIVRKTKGDFEGALTDFSKAINLHPNYPKAYYQRALVNQIKRDFDVALADYDKAIELNPRYAAAYHSRGCLRYDSRQFREAAADFRKACDLRPIRLPHHSRLWLVQAKMGEQKEATEELLALLQDQPEGADAAWNENVARFLCGQLSEGDFLRTVENPDSDNGLRLCVAAWFFAGTRRLIDGDKPAAVEFFE